MKLVSAEFCRGAGLGNKLFPWARAKIYSNMNNCPMLRTRWFSPHGGAITRGGIDYAKALRKIWLLRNFRNIPGEIPHWKFLLQYRTLPISFARSLNDLPSEDGHLIFKWNAHHDFLDLKGCQKFLMGEIYRMTNPSQLAFIDQYKGRDFIGLNIRCGRDFVTKESGMKGYVRTELDWFCDALREVRKKYGNMPAVVVSDGGERQLSLLFKEHNVHLLKSETAVADLLVLTKARVLLGSGNSTFSAWASFLGEMDTYSSIDTPFNHAGLDDGCNGTKIVGII